MIKVQKRQLMWVGLTITPLFLISIIVFELHFCPSAASIYNFENETPNKKIDHCRHCEFDVKLEGDQQLLSTDMNLMMSQCHIINALYRARISRCTRQAAQYFSVEFPHLITILLRVLRYIKYVNPRSGCAAMQHVIPRSVDVTWNMLCSHRLSEDIHGQGQDHPPGLLLRRHELDAGLP